MSNLKRLEKCYKSILLKTATLPRLPVWEVEVLQKDAEDHYAVSYRMRVDINRPGNVKLWFSISQESHHSYSGWKGVAQLSNGRTYKNLNKYWSLCNVYDEDVYVIEDMAKHLENMLLFKADPCCPKFAFSDKGAGIIWDTGRKNWFIRHLDSEPLKCCAWCGCALPDLSSNVENQEKGNRFASIANLTS